MSLTNSQISRAVSSANPVNSSPELFDDQAPFFEQRTGLREDCCRDIAKRVIEIGKVEPNDLVIEVAPGTGQIGLWFKAPVRYIGFDLSAGMLREFRQRSSRHSNNPAVIQADANALWPVADSAARVIFSSRAMHLLDLNRVAAEVFRVASSAGATLILGRVERSPDSVRKRMAKEMNERLRERGFEPRGGERQNRKLFELCRRRGAEILDPVRVATWKVSASPRQSLDSWRRLSILGGIQVPATTRAEMLRELSVWAEEKFGGLDEESESEESYVLKPLSIPATHTG